MDADDGTGGSHAARERFLGRAGNRGGNLGIAKRCGCRRQHPAGADLDHDELHDGLQLAGGDVPIRLRYSGYAADRRGDVDQQCQREHVLLAQLLDAAGVLSDDLRQGFPVPVAVPSQPRSAIDSVIESKAFSVAD